MFVDDTIEKAFESGDPPFYACIRCGEYHQNGIPYICRNCPTFIKETFDNVKRD